MVNFETTAFYAGPSDTSQSYGDLHQYTYLQLLGWEGDYVKVWNPRTGVTGYVLETSVGPTDPPPAFITAPPPPAVEAVNMPGRVVGSADLAFYPVADQTAYTNHLGHNASVFIAATVLADDGSTWYRTSDGDYLPSDKVRLPQPPPRTFSGKWIDVLLTEPAILTAYEDDRPVMATLAIKGAGPLSTPTGVFAIQRRVANETMNSETLGVPRNAPGGYYLTNVLYTQYFLPTGESIHYNYWSSNFGYQGSHGCLGLSYADSQFLWNWDTIGTPVSIHY